MRTPVAFALALTLAACDPTASPPAPVSAPPPPPPGLDRVMGKTLDQLTALLGKPAQDLREPKVRRLVFISPACVLDAYLYAKPGQPEPVVTWVDARKPNGDDFDRASCVGALALRPRTP
ncbi:hypothetical protein [Sphingomonas sp. ID0503]|uniref:hypothetical protein n=1 Tax=Sphingomonas sp. ID0503 TaxID=3399691 RepID=UPI003AFA7418